MISVKIDTADLLRFKSRIDDFVEEAGKTNREAMELLAKACAKELAITVPPFGVSAKVGDQFQKSIAKQVDRAIRSGNVDGDSGSAAQIHAAKRDRRGQVPKGLRTRGQYQREPISVRDKETLVDRKQAAAGIVKGAWIAAGEKLNGKKITGVGRWVRRHAKANGDAEVSVKNASAEVEITNRCSYVANVQSTENVQLALKRGYLRNYRHMTIVLKKIRKEI